MKRKILSLLLGLIMLLPLCLAACSGGQNEDPNDNPPIVTPGDPDDGLYPSDPNFDALSGFDSTDTSRWGEAKAHDPSVIEADGKFYVFSTDNDGGYGYQVRTSDDLIHWSFVGFAIENCGTSVSDAKSTYEAGNGGLQEVYEILVEDSEWGRTSSGSYDPNGSWPLWAPDVVKGSDGKYWLYGCWTAGFGQGHSVIFLCKANSVTGPYSFDSILLYSYDGWPTNYSNPNAIDPQIYYVGDRMFMAYGSFSGGTWTIELDPETGLRADGLSGNDLLPEGNKTPAERYGERLVNGTVTEGPTINYHENVAIYPDDVESIRNYDESKLTYEDRYYLMGSADSLFTEYNMRSFVGTIGEDGLPEFTSYLGDNGNRVSGSFSWKTRRTDRDISFDFFAPGHNDMLTTSDGKNVIVYHNRLTLGSAGNHYLFVSSYAFNSRGDLVINPNRYAGETLRTIETEELADKEFYYVLVDSNNYAELENGGYAQSGLVLNADNTISLNDEEAGVWYLYGDYYVYMQLNGTEYYGVAMPAWIQKESAGGITISLLSKDGADTLYMNINL